MAPKRTLNGLMFALVPILVSTLVPRESAVAENLRVERVTVISPERAQPLRNATVIVRDDHIVSVDAETREPATAEETVIDGNGLYLTPGLIDSHVHLSEIPGMTPAQQQAHPDITRAARAQFPRSYLLYGYTTLVDLNSTPDRIADMQAFALEAGADIIAHGMWHWEVPPATTPPAAAPALGTVSSAVKTILDEVVARKVGWQPTMQVLYGELDLLDPSYLAKPELARVNPAGLIEWYRRPAPEGQWYRDEFAGNFPKNADGSTRSADELSTMIRTIYAPILTQQTNAAAYVAQHDGNVLFGTDTPSSPTYANPPGLNGFIEMRRWVAAGMSPAEIFRAATLANAEALRLTQSVGTVQAGKRANLLLMRDDPTRSVDAYASIVKVIIGGRLLDAADLIADRAEGD